jgi:phenylacetate-CoA oxygenase PaaI subunit
VSESSPGTGLFETATDQDAMQRAVAAAAPTTAERVDVSMVQSLDPDMRVPMFALLSSLADNKYMLGRRYAEWCTGAPMLESAVAAAAMAQDELGHARSFYPLLRGFSAGRDLPPMEEKGWQQRPTSAMRCLDRRFSGWADFVAANLVVDSALTALLTSAIESRYEPLRQRARKIQQEESAHWVHAVGWTHRLPASSVLAAFTRVWDDAFTWFGAADDAVIAPLQAASLLAASPNDLRQRLRARLEPVLDEVGLAEPLLARELPWSDWDPVARRLRT